MSRARDEGRGLRFLYRTVPGRCALKLAASRPVSKAAGAFLDSPLSRPLIAPFARGQGIVLSDYVNARYGCFNDFFCRKIRPELRPLCPDADALIAPCDGLLSVYRLSGNAVLPVKQSRYTVEALLNGDPIAARYRDGLCLIFRLCVDHYHRYSYPADGEKGPNVFIPGQLHTVRPIALQSVPVFARNCREYTVLQTERFGALTQMEVGAMLVGRIVNHHGPGPVRRGEEKGLFQYGGSTVVLLVEKDRLALTGELSDACGTGRELPVKLGQMLGKAVR